MRTILDPLTHTARTHRGLALSRLRRVLDSLSTYGSGHVGPCLRSTMHHLESWHDGTRAHPDDPEAYAIADAFCEAAEEIRSHDGWPYLIDCPWLGWQQEAARLLRTAEKLCPMILSKDQCTFAGIDPDR